LLPIDGRDVAARVAVATGVTRTLGCLLNSRRIRGDLVRAVNYHATPAADRDQFRRHLEYYVRQHEPLAEADLASFLAGDRTLARPGLLLTFDDGYKSNYEVAAELLDEFGVKGIFFVAAGFIQRSGNGPAAAQYVRDNLFRGYSYPGWSDTDCQPMSWDDLRDLVRRGHAVGSHGMNHLALGPDTGVEALQQEIVESKAVIERELGAVVSSFCWPFGTLSSYSRQASEFVRRHYRYAFTTFAAPLFVGGAAHAIDRASVGADMGLARVRWAVEGPAEIYFLNRRRRFMSIVGAHDVE
jgi:peptidoglycan/xylan/chitin deacetylase (PgdA/CDA1 family)